MTERLTQCKKCKKSGPFETVKEHNPDTADMNMRVTLKCSCGHIDEYSVASYSHREKRRRGFCR